MPYDPTPRIGWKALSLPDTHPFFLAAKIHDARYDGLIAKDSRLTLKEIDREFLRNCLRIASREKWFGNTYLPPLFWQAYSFYRIVRFWAKYVRPELEAYRPQ